ncbi:hypothetical protein GCM10023195_14270 [Actinoallomurus liliacearum]|uniref:CHAT domain-containing protein n=1 Tax=Actinoallomurus liliacearum TaxID=1080073 RepID=A0ABP8TEB5_9ACTN
MVDLRVDDVRLLITAVPEDSEHFEIALLVNPYPVPVDALARCGLALSSAAGLLHAALIDAGGLAIFRGVPAGTWRVEVVPPAAGAGEVPAAGTTPLPAVRRGIGAISAAEDRYAVRTPSGVTIVVTEPVPGAFEAEVTSTGDGLDLVGLHYQTDEAEPRTLYVPVVGSATGPPAARVRLPDLAPAAPWEADDAVAPDAPGLWDTEILGRSVRAAADRGTRRAWRSVAVRAPEDVAHAVLTALASDRVGDSADRGRPPDPIVTSRPRTIPTSATGGWDLYVPDESAGPRFEPPPPAQETPPRRFVAADLPMRAPVGEAVSLLVRVTTDDDRDRYRAHRPVKPFAVPAEGTQVLVVVEAPVGLLPQEGLERRLTVPAAGVSEPIRFPFVVRAAGLLPVRVTAWLGPRCVGELALELSAQPGGPTVPGPSRRAGLDDARPTDGEATLQVRRGAGGGYSFQLLSNSVWYDPVPGSEGGVLSESIERTLAMLEEFAAGSAGYTDAAARMSLREIGVGLWQELVPEAIKEQFWELRGRLRSFSIATDHDIVPWELLYPLAGRNDHGFLVEQFPVVRRVYGQPRTPRIALRGPAFVVPPDAPPLAHEEITAINRLLRETFAADRAEIISRLEPLKSWIDSGHAGLLHFASHNQFALTAGGSSIAMADGDFLPMMLNSSVTRAVLSRHPLVFINACRSAGAAYGYTRPMSWASKFMAAGAGAFVGTLWAIPSDVARHFSEAFYDAFIRQRLPFGTAMTAARRAVRSDRDPSWLAYTAYSDPEARWDEPASTTEVGHGE